MECEVWGTATMIGGLFIYNHKGEVLISRVYRDDIGWVSSSWVENALKTASETRNEIYFIVPDREICNGLHSQHFTKTWYIKTKYPYTPYTYK